MKRPSPLKYYRTGNNDLQPFYRELEAIRFWTIAESILLNVLMAAEELQNAQTALDRPRADRFLATRKRFSEEQGELFIYETFFGMPIGDVPCVAFSWDGKTAIALWPGYRSKLEATNKLSDYPYLSDAVGRLAEENNLTPADLAWETN